MVNFIMIAFCLSAGMIFRYTKLIPADAYKGINIWIIYLALPAVSFKYIPKIDWIEHTFFPALAPIILWAGGWIFIKIYCKHKKYGLRSRSSLELASCFSNTSFIGFPLIVAYFAEKDLSIAIICDQMTFILISTVGIISAVNGSPSNKSGVKPSFLLKRLVTFPPLIGCALALALSFLTDLTVAEPFFDKIAATVGPLGLFSVGLQLKFKGWQQEVSQITMSILYKLMIGPALVLLVALLLNMKGDFPRIGVFEAAMPTLITSSIIAEQFRLNTRLVNLIIGVSILIGFLTTALWSVITVYFLS